MIGRPQKHSRIKFLTVLCFLSKMTVTSKQTLPKPGRSLKGDYLQLMPSTSLYQLKIFPSLYSTLFWRSLFTKIVIFHFLRMFGSLCNTSDSLSQHYSNQNTNILKSIVYPTLPPKRCRPRPSKGGTPRRRGRSFPLSAPKNALPIFLLHAEGFF